jgi:adenylate cyclase class 2
MSPCSLPGYAYHYVDLVTKNQVLVSYSYFSIFSYTYAAEGEICMSKDIEIELKLPLHNAAEVIDFLSANAIFKYKSLQHDVYYNAPHRDFLADKGNVSEWLRIRIEKDKAQINYKDFQPHVSSIKTHCKEYETDVASYEQLTKILDALNFEKLVDVKKTRKAWEYKDTEVSVDSVTGLGEYLEVEYKGDHIDNVEAVRDYLHTIVETIGAETGELEHRGYPYLLLAKKKLL